MLWGMIVSCRSTCRISIVHLLTFPFLPQSALTGITRNFSEVVVARFFLGFVEAAFLPGALFMLSKWYTKKEIAVSQCLVSAHKDCD